MVNSGSEGGQKEWNFEINSSSHEGLLEDDIPHAKVQHAHDFQNKNNAPISLGLLILQIEKLASLWTHRLFMKFLIDSYLILEMRIEFFDQ